MYSHSVWGISVSFLACYEFVNTLRSLTDYKEIKFKLFDSDILGLAKIFNDPLEPENIRPSEAKPDYGI